MILRFFILGCAFFLAHCSEDKGNNAGNPAGTSSSSSEGLSSSSLVEPSSSSDLLSSSSAMPSSSSIQTDITYEGETYKTVVIGPLTWITKNLNYNAPGSKCYDGSAANCDKYGRLYNWETAKTVCPSGWRLPTKEEWESITASPTAGKDLKTVEWGGTDMYGFAAVLGGYGNSDGDFSMAGKQGIWWADTQYSANYAHCVYIFREDEGAQLLYELKTDLYSVRCVNSSHTPQ